MKDNHRFCSFCGKPEDLVKKLIAGQNGAYICDDPACIEKCVKNKLIGRALEAPVSDEVYEYIAKEYAKSKN